MRLFFVSVLYLMFLSVSINASSPISAPWISGDTWQGAGSCGGSYYNEVPYHVSEDGKVSRYAIDFNRFPVCQSDPGYPILAVKDGVVSYADTRQGFGNTVEIDHGEFDGKTLTSFYAHLQDGDPIVVQVGETVKQGQVIGYCGESGGTSSGEHLHFELREDGWSVEITAMDSYHWCEDQTCRGHVLTSMNTSLLDEAYNRFGAPQVGNREYDMWDLVSAQAANANHPWYNPWNQDRYRTNNIPNNCVIQHLEGGLYWDGAIVYDGLGGARKAYVLHSGFWVNWTNDNGPLSSLGMPITDEYSTGINQARQDFQLGYLLYEQGAEPEITFNGYTAGTYAPGWTEAGWNPQYSYLFAQKYEELGGQPALGDAVSLVTMNGDMYIQDFAGGNLGVSCTRIVFDRGDATESRVQLYCFPTCSYVDKFPDGTPQYQEWQLAWFQVQFKNEGVTPWTNDSNSDNYVELKACDVNGEVLHAGGPILSPLYHRSWKNEESPCTMLEAEVAPGQIATFEFIGQVTDPNGNGVTAAYFRPNHSSGVLMNGWGNMHFQLEVRAGWFATLPQNDCDGPVDGSVHKWFESDFARMEEGWVSVTIPNANWGCNTCDRFYRLWYDYAGTQSGNGESIHFVSDDAIAIWINGVPVGSWGAGCHGSGCVNGSGGCNPNYLAPDIDITSYLHEGKNLVAVHVSESGGGEHFNMQFLSQPLQITENAICCLGDEQCQEISDAYSSSSCIGDGGTVYVGGWFDCETFSSCVNAQIKGRGDPTLFFQTVVPLPMAPAEVTFDLIDTIPRSAWYDLPDVLGGERLYVSDFVGSFSIAATPSANADTLDIIVTDYSFECPTVNIDVIPTGTNYVHLDTTAIMNPPGTYCISTGMVDVIVQTVITNDLYPESNPIRSKSQIRGHLDSETGLLVVGSESYNVLPEGCCLGNTGNVNCDPQDAVNLTDLTVLVDHLFINFTPLCCMAEANISGDVEGQVTLTDLTLLVDHLFISFGPTASCN